MPAPDVTPQPDNSVIVTTKEDLEAILADNKITVSDAPRILKILQSFRAVSWTWAVGLAAVSLNLYFESVPKDNTYLVAAGAFLVWGIGTGIFDSVRKIGA